MGSQKKYSKYRAYQFLEPGVDYVAFDLAKEIGRVQPYSIPLSESEKKRVANLLAACVVISLHEHPVVLPENVDDIYAYESAGREYTGYEGLSVSHLDAVFDNLTDGTGPITSRMGWKWSDVVFDVGMRLCDIAHQDFVIKGETASDIEIAHKKGKIALFPSLEAATMIENELDRIDILYGLGIRMMGVVYSESNGLGSGMKESRDGGLTSFGREAVKRMNKIGMAIDVSHAGDQTSIDTIAVSKKPVFISHAGARALWNSKRMKPDNVLLACAEKGGVIGIEAAPHTTLSDEYPDHSIESVMQHFEYCVNLVGIESVAFGPDTMFGDHLAAHHVFSAQLAVSAMNAPTGQEEHKESEYVKGLENPAECFPNIARWLVKHNYHDDEIEKVLGDNVLRALKEAWSW